MSLLVIIIAEATVYCQRCLVLTALFEKYALCTRKAVIHDQVMSVCIYKQYMLHMFPL